MLSGAVYLLLFAGQGIASRDVVRLPVGRYTIPQEYGGKTVELLDALPDISLPSLHPSAAQPFANWSVEIKNLGPRAVTIRNGDQLKVLLRPNDSAAFTRRGPSAYVRVR
jgi:hypothetical protein